jgi:allene oxide cyclase
MKINEVAMLTIAALVTAPAFARERLQFVERAMVEAVLHLGVKGDSAGDILTFPNPVYDADNKVQLGMVEGYCVRVTVGASWDCVSTLIIKEGQIRAEGPLYDQGDSVFAVTGGTGKYIGARGQMTLHAREAPSATSDTFASTYEMVYELL